MKKIMTILAAAAVALTLVGCANFGDAKASGNKYKKTYSIDATGDLGKDASGKDNAYARAFTALSASKKCSAIETTVSLPMGEDATKPENIPISAEGLKSVVGLAFDVHETEGTDGKKYYDFVLVGVKPSDGGFYIEKYENVSKDNLKETMNTSDGAIDGAARGATTGAKFTDLDGKTSGNWANGTIKTFADATKIATDGYSWKIKVTQDTAGTYEVLINDVKKATYKRDLTEAEGKAKTPKAYGQVFMYLNAPKGTKVKAIFESNKDNTVGLFADEEEF